MSDDEARSGASWPDESYLADVQWVAGPHPAIVETEDLLSSCQLTFHRRGGPGGQHRNKVSSAVVILHQPSGISVEASERRDQSQNRVVAIDRLRLRLALLLRTTPASANNENIEIELRSRWHRRPLKISDSNHDYCAVLALLLDDLHRAGGQPSLVAKQWEVSTSSLIQLISKHPPALQLVNRWRTHHGRPALK